MPYDIVKRGMKWVVINKQSGDIKGHHRTKAKAMAQFRLLQGIEHGWKPNRNR